MPAYVIAEIQTYDPVKYEEYKQCAAAAVATYGGRYLARGGRVEALEGNAPERLVILEFPSMREAKGWWESESYTAARQIRHTASHARFILVEGL